MRNVFRNGVTLALAFLLAFWLRADSGFQFKNYSTTEGWPDAAVNCILQDTLGFLWVGTADGLVRFDGKKVRLFNQKDGLSDDYITSSFISSTGKIYFGHFTGGVSVFNGHSFESLRVPSTVGQIKQISEDEKGNIWILGSALGKQQDDGFELVTFPELKDKILNQFAFEDQQLMVATNDGLLVFGPDMGSPVGYTYLKAVLPGFAVTSMEIADGGSRFWIGTDLFGLYRWTNSKNLQNPPVVLPIFSDIIPKGETLQELFEDDRHNLWISTRLRGLYSIKFTDDLSMLEHHGFNVQTGFRSALVTSIFEDNEGSMWIGTADAGLEQLIERQISFFNLKDKLGVEQVNSVLQTPTGDFMLGTDQGLVRMIYDVNSDFFGERRFEEGELSSIPISYLFDDRRSHYWLGTFGYGIYKMDRKGHALHKVRLPNALDRGTIRHIAIDKDGHIWISVSGFGVYKLDNQGSILDSLSTRTGFIHNEIYFIYPDSYGNVWFATHAAGLAVLRKDQSLWYPTKDGEFAGRDINAILEDSNHNIWIATDGDGLFRFDHRKFENYRAENGLKSDYCKGLITDNGGNIWVAHSNGLSQVNSALGTIETYGKSNGLQAESYLPNACIKDGQGNIWWGNPIGITRIESPEEYMNTLNLPTNLTEVNLYRRSNNLLTSMAQQGQSLELRHHQNHITFNFIAVSLKKQEGVTYQFRLLGYEELWSPEVKENSATYTNLTPGQYTFQVRTSKVPIAGDHRTASIQITIAKPFWQRGWFYLTEIVFLLGLVLLAYNSQKAKHRWIAQFMIYVCLFVLFEFVHTMIAPYLEGYTGGVPIFQVLLHLLLALALFPMERFVKLFLRKNQNITVIKRS